ncbi:MAG: hypothetical protein ACXWP6_07685 [Ktedonobacterales bacterium]
MAENQQAFPLNWRIGQDFDPNEHLMQLKGRDYLNVQNRLLWFIRDQRALIVAGLAKVPYVVQTDLVELDRDTSWAHFKTYVRDVLGNEATMYGSESAKDFADYAEKASTKSLGRALLALGYGTAFAPEMDEGERVVDSPVERDRRTSSARERQTSVIRETPAAREVREPAANASAPTRPNPAAHLNQANEMGRGGDEEPKATEAQRASIRKLCTVLGKSEPDEVTTQAQARELISQLSREYQEQQRARRAS